MDNKFIPKNFFVTLLKTFKTESMKLGIHKATFVDNVHKAKWHNF